jgi:hypothetical protein
MKRFGRLTVILSAVFAALLLSVRINAQSRLPPNSLQSLGFDICNGKPCFRGLVPGRVSKDVAATVLAEFAVLDPTYGYWQAFDGNKLYFNTSDVGIVSEIVVTLAKPQVTLGTVIAAYGIPCNVSIYPIQCNTYLSCSGWASMSFDYDAMHVGIILSAGTSTVDRLSPDLSISGLSLVDPSQFLRDADTCHLYHPDEIGSLKTPWLGFTSIEHYVQFAKDKREND